MSAEKHIHDQNHVLTSKYMGTKTIKKVFKMYILHKGVLLDLFEILKFDELNDLISVYLT